MSKKKVHTIHAVVSARQKKVLIMQGKKILKVYSFKMDVPSKMVTKECQGYDHGAWSVSDRDFSYTKEVLEWDEKTINEIRTKALEHYKQTT